jgi:hypothetical protein
MKYASNMPIRSYETTIGSFNMVDLSSYYVVDDSIFESDNITIDNSETLIEAAKNIYGDVDSFWLFLFANKKINPFELLQSNNTNLFDETSGKTGFSILDQAYDGIFPSGSLVFPYVADNGITWNYGSTGNFSLTGGFALVDSFNSFSKRIVIRYLEGFTLSDDPNVNYWGVVKGKTEYTTYKNVSSNYPLAINSGTIKQEVSVVDTVDYLTADKQPYVSVKSEYPLLKKGPPSIPPAYEPVGTGGTEITINTELDNRIPAIKAYIPSTVKNSAFIRIVQNYEV